MLTGTVLLRVFHADRAESVKLLRDHRTDIGRARPADLVIPDPTLSRRHATLFWDAGHLMIRDLGSSNGTFVNGRRVTDAVELRPGDRLELGSVVANLELDDETTGGIRLIPYEQLAHALQHELTRARAFGSSAALFFVRATSQVDRHISLWLRHIESSLREVDSVATFGLESALVLLPEMTVTAAAGVAERIAASSRRAGVPLVISVVAAPEHGTSADELIEAAARLASGDDGDVRRPELERTSWSDEGMLILSEAMRDVDRLVRQVASTDITVLIHGETGTGKELVAHAIVERSTRTNGPFRSVNCAAIAPSLLESTLFGHVRGAFTGADKTQPGLFEQAHEGTLFLDEIAELSASAQAALLRVLELGALTRVGGREEITVDVRIVAATHRDLQAMASRGEFRLDLVYRLNTVVIDIPPLRRRQEEIEPLARHFLRQAAEKHRRGVTDLSAEVLDALLHHPWPGNVRELRNVIERAVVITSGDTIELDSLPNALRPSAVADTQRFTIPPVAPSDSSLPFKERVQSFERQLMLDALQRTGGNKTAAAKELDMPLRTFMTKVKTYGIEE